MSNFPLISTGFAISMEFRWRFIGLSIFLGSPLDFNWMFNVRWTLSNISLGFQISLDSRWILV